MKPRRSLIERLYRHALVLCPRSFRDTFAEEMVDLLRDRLRASERGSGESRAAVVWRTSLDLLVTSADLRLESLRSTFSARPVGQIPYHTRLNPRGSSMLQTLSLDLHSARRALMRRPATTAAIVATLAIGIGANTALFSVIDRVLIRPLPFSDPDRLVVLHNRYGNSATMLSPPDFMDRRERSELLESSAAYRFPISLNLGSAEASTTSSRKVTAARVTADFFSVLGAAPSSGRVLFPGPRSSADTGLVVISHRLWQEQFGGNFAIVGTSIQLHGSTATVSAVMGPEVDFPRGVDLWIPLVFTPEQLSDDNRGNENLTMLGRMSSGVSLDQLAAEMETIAASVLVRVPDRAEFLARNGWGASTNTLEHELVGDVRAGLWILLAAVGLVLLLVCVNVAGLLLARTAERTRELALRSSLGATRPRLLRQLLTENVLLGLGGCALGLVLARFALDLAPRWVPQEVPRLDSVALDARVGLFAIALTLLCSLIFGSAPAWQGSSLELGGLTRITSITARRPQQMRAVLVVAQLALALVLLIGAGLLVESFGRLLATEPGFEAGQRLALRLTLPEAQYPTSELQLAYQQQAAAKLEALPGIQRAAIANRLPLDGRGWTGSFSVLGYELAAGEPSPGAQLNTVGPGFFATLGVPLRAGREFEPTDATGARVVVVDERTAERFWPGRSAVGEQIYFSTPDRSYEIVGVVGNVKQMSLIERGELQVYLSAGQFPESDLAIVVQTNTGSPQAQVNAVRQALLELDPGVPPHAVRSLDSMISSAVGLPRFHALLISAFSLVSILLASIGLYGLLSYSVAQRTSEIGTRMALGASKGAILGMVVARGLRLLAIGTVVGLATAYGLTRFLAGLLHGVDARDPRTFVLVSAGLLVVGLLAALLPAMRAAEIDPTQAMRQ